MIEGEKILREYWTEQELSARLQVRAYFLPYDLVLLARMDKGLGHGEQEYGIVFTRPHQYCPECAKPVTETSFTKTATIHRCPNFHAWEV